MGGLQAVVCQRECNYNGNNIDDDNGDIVQQYNVIHDIDAKPHVCGDSGLSTVDFRAEPICWNQTSQNKIKGVRRIMLKGDNGNNDIVREY